MDDAPSPPPASWHTDPFVGVTASALVGGRPLDRLDRGVTGPDPSLAWLPELGQLPAPICWGRAVLRVAVAPPLRVESLAEEPGGPPPAPTAAEPPAAPTGVPRRRRRGRRVLVAAALIVLVVLAAAASAAVLSGSAFAGGHGAERRHGVPSRPARSGRPAPGSGERRSLVAC